MLNEAEFHDQSPKSTRGLLRSRFLSERKVMENLCLNLSAEDCMVSATDDTSPPKWHLAHVSWFYEHFILSRFAFRYEIYDPRFNYLFNSYYRNIGEFLPKSKRHLISNPSLKIVLDYRNWVTDQVAELLEKSSQSVYEKIMRLIDLGINHEQQHQELLLMDIKRNFFEMPTHPTYRAHSTRETSGTPSPLIYQPYAGGIVKIGSESTGFYYDNESGRHRVFLESFELSDRLIHNAEFLDFIEAGGYENSSYWLSDGWDYIQREKIKLPLYWTKKESHYFQMTLQGLTLLDPAEPVSHVSYFEAQAYATFKGARLPTEAEWEHAATFDDRRFHFLEENTFHPIASNSFHGNLWEWTQSAYLPYPGYQAFDDGLSEYNSKFMCNQFVLRGGSCVTPLTHYRPTYRNFYYPQMRWQFCGFRLARDTL